MENSKNRTNSSVSEVPQAIRDPHEKSPKTMVHVIPYHNDDDFIDVQKSLRVEKGTKCFGHFQRKVRSEMTGYSIGEKQPENMVNSPVPEVPKAMSRSPRKVLKNDVKTMGFPSFLIGTSLDADFFFGKV